MIEFMSEEKLIESSREIVKRYLKYQTKGVRVKTIAEAIRNEHPRLYIDNPMMMGIIKEIEGDEIEGFVAVHSFGKKKSPVKQLRYRSKE